MLISFPELGLPRGLVSRRPRHHHRHPHGATLAIRRGIGVSVGADDLAAVVDAAGESSGSLGEIDPGEGTLGTLVQEAATGAITSGAGDEGRNASIS
jgi:hypothetical protein